ncbi:acyl-CoA synthetase [Iamia sp. SCSIO 61187]|uniref:acyl-CoA synthetase n=1 Tax=Iamia sp. SCSIO 61187 TaxID=2722752 RepID=UPI001C62ECEB|nr:acyl-CoA synthetase [Iamia sp. SCSIO 61187]QYG93844.1 acyl-CoA synthetase [Iamia sp. SCSIO 61187]
MPTNGWNFAEVWEVIAEQIPEAQAQVQGERRYTWKQFDERANGVAHALLASGVSEQDKVAQYLYNGPEYLESVYASWKAGLAPLNTNYRYADDELVYLWDNADAVAVVFHGAFVDTIERIRDRVPRVRLWLWVDDGSGPCPDWAAPYEEAATSNPERAMGPWGRSGDHLYMLYTGGTTGMPKGVMWRQDDLFRNLIGSAIDATVREGEPDLESVRARVTKPGMVGLPACPLMHGTGCFTQLITLSGGGSCVTLESRTLDVAELLDTIDREAVNLIAIVGDAFAKPINRALAASPDRWSLASLLAITSSGVMFSEPVKQELLTHAKSAMIIDAFSSSEAVGMGQSISSAGAEVQTAKFTVGENTRVIGEDGTDVVPGSGEIGRVAVGGFQPIGYYKDETKSAATFLVLDGKRYSVPGDFAQVEADGSITLLGRGSVCINTGGEKVFPEEVEEVLKLHPAIADAVAVGLPDEKFGESITGVVELVPDAELDEADVIAHVKGKLASYKAPKRVLPIETIGRAPNGKVDYKRLKAWAADTVTAG